MQFGHAFVEDKCPRADVSRLVSSREGCGDGHHVEQLGV